MTEEKLKKLKKESLGIFILIAISVFLLGMYVGTEIGEKKTEERMISKFDTIEINGTFYELNKTYSLGKSGYVMPKYHKLSGNKAVITRVEISFQTSPSSYPYNNKTQRFMVKSNPKPKFCEYEYRRKITNGELGPEEKNPFYPCNDTNTYVGEANISNFVFFKQKYNKTEVERIYNNLSKTSYLGVEQVKGEDEN